MIQFIVKGKIENPPKEFRKLNDHYIADYKELTREERRYLKQNFPQGYFRLQIWERGGGTFDGGEAQLVCGLNGERLRPVKIRRKGWLANSRHALFVGNTLCVVNVKRENREFFYTINRYSVKPKIGIVEEDLLWSGNDEDIEELPVEIESFKEVLQEAKRKVLEYRCTYPMYYEREEE